MSTKYPGGFITKSPVAPTTSAASGIWTLDQQQQAQKAGTWPSPPVFIEDFFSTYLYTGTGAAQTITNGIDLSTYGGLVWFKDRTVANSNRLFDTVRGASSVLTSNTTGAAFSSANMVTSFNTTGFSVGTDTSGGVNDNGDSFVSWTFREQPKFFDIVTYTGNNSGQAISHNLGSVPGAIIVKCTTAVTNWVVYHRSLGSSAFIQLSTTGSAVSPDTAVWGGVDPTSTQFTVGTSGACNASGNTYVAYLFAHDAGGFPASGSGSTNGITCGTYTGTGSPFNVTLGYEPQWVLVKKTSATGDWILMDTMRGMATNTSQWLYPNLFSVEDASGTQLNPTATGFTVTSSGSGLNGGGATYIYIAIRRGPMKTPTVGTSVYNGVARTGTSAAATVTGVGFTPDISWTKIRSQPYPGVLFDRLRGALLVLKPSNDDGEASSADSLTGFDVMDGVNLGGGGGGRINTSPDTYINWYFKRAPGFFDEVCYTGNGSASGQVITHNLSVTPELIIIKSRSGTGLQWHVYAAPLGQSKALFLETNGAEQANSAFTGGTINSSQFELKVDFSNVNGSGVTYVSYLFATLAGISKVGSYTGTGAAQTINCGFTAGVRFVFIKRTDSTGNWYIWDSTRGIVPSNDPYLFIDIDDAEVTGTDYIDTTSVGFDITSTAPAAINANGGTFIFLAIA
jgi:hypothetical protein